MLAIYRYEWKRLWQSNKLTAPFVILLVWIFVADTIAPLSILSTFSICSLVLFFIMVIAGLKYGELDGRMTDQCIYARIDRKHKFYLARVLVMATVAAGMTVIAEGLPLLLHLINNFSLFDRPVVESDILSGMLLFFLTGLCGGTAGIFINARICSRREIAMLIAPLFAIASCVKIAIVSEVPILKYVLWILPPISDLGASYCQDTFFSMQSSGPYFLWLVAYIIVLTAAYDAIMIRRAFE